MIFKNREIYGYLSILEFEINKNANFKIFITYKGSKSFNICRKNRTIFNLEK